MKRSTVRRLMIASVSGVTLGLAGSATVLALVPAAEEQAPQVSAVSLYVTVAEAKQVSWPVILSASGVIAPWQEAVISSQVDGLRISDIAVDIGDIVKRGQRLAVLDDRMLRAQERELAALLQQAHSTEAQARADAERADALGQGGALSRQEVLRIRTEATTAGARVDAAAAQLHAKRIEIAYASILAPDDGIISARTAALGEVAPSGQELFRLIRQGRLEWRGELTATQVSQVVVGQVVDLALPDGQTANARIRQTSPTLAQNSRLGTVYADLTAGESAKAGMYAAGAIRLEAAAALVVPASGVVVRDGRSFVFVVQDEGGRHAVAARPVEVGRRNARDVEITSGIDAGTRIAAEGSEFLADGDVVGIAPAMAEAVQ